MRLPPESILLAAKRWLEILPTSSGIPRAQALLTTHVKYSDLTPTQYASALTLLHELELIQGGRVVIPPGSRVLGALLERAAPTWFSDADQLVRSPDELPSDIITAGRALGLNEVEVYHQLVSSWGKVDTAARERVGAAGEAQLVRSLESVPGSRVDHVSEWSDGFGYDISYSRGRTFGHLEVKSTTRAGRFTAYLSRHEYSVMKRDDRWVFVAVRLTGDLNISAVGSVSNEWIEANVPRDQGPFGSWASCKLEIPTEVIASPLLELGEAVADRLPTW
ncbi:DUF3883 domain-containing protein [Gordonia rubripertincta]|uniref:protein NO VEIN domain-containing protein n=1 Tax=Gordonia rubripertincta TaxID=36822 RepID=UPI00117F06F9|nr:DUF3883 domain-containing protein [Gordonia rubripertincta]